MEKREKLRTLSIKSLAFIIYNKYFINYLVISIYFRIFATEKIN